MARIWRAMKSSYKRGYETNRLLVTLGLCFLALLGIRKLSNNPKSTATWTGNSKGKWKLNNGAHTLTGFIHDVRM